MAPSNPPPFDPAQLRAVRLSLGPMQIGNFLNSILLGVLLLQAGQYYQNFRDPLWIRGLVTLALLIDVAQSALMMYMTWEYTVSHFGDFVFLGKSIWTLSSIPFFSVPVSWIVQGFFAWRIQIITKKRYYTAVIVLFAVIQGTFGIYAGVESFMDNSTADNKRIQKIAIVWFVFAMLCDVTIMLIMIWSLSQSKTGFKDTDTLITKINRSILETGAATTVTVLIDCLFLFLIPGTDMHLVPVMAVGKVYSNSFLYILNSRGSYRKVSSLQTADFAHSFNDALSDPSTRQARVVAANGTWNANSSTSGRRGLSALKFAKNDAVTTRGTIDPGAIDSEPAVYVTRDVYAMSNFAGDEVGRIESRSEVGDRDIKPELSDAEYPNYQYAGRERGLGDESKKPHFP